MSNYIIFTYYIVKNQYNNMIYCIFNLILFCLFLLTFMNVVVYNNTTACLENKNVFYNFLLNYLNFYL